MSVLVFSEAGSMAGRLNLLFLGFITPLVFSTRLEDGFELPQILCVLIALVFFVLMCRSGDWARAFKGNGALFLCALGFGGAGTYSFARSVKTDVFYFPTENYLWILTFFLFLAPAHAFLEKRKLYASIALAGVLGSFYSFAQFMGLDFSGWNTHFGGRSFSTLGNPTFWAGQLLVGIPLALYLALSSEGKRQKWFWWAAVGILTASLLMTQTRGAWLGFLGEVMLSAILTRRRGLVWRGLILGMIAFLLALLLVPSWNERAVSLFRIHDRDAQGRYFLWEAAAGLWKEKKWMGQGPGGYANGFGRIQALIPAGNWVRPYWTALHAHNDYGELLAERGVVGASLAGILLWILIRRRWKRIDPIFFSMETAELALLLGIGVHAFFHFPFSIAPTACAMALLFNPSWEQDGGGDPGGSPLWNEFRFLLGIGLFLICGLGMKVFAQNARLHQAVDLAEGQKYEEALRVLTFEPSSRFFNYLDPRVLKQRAVVLAALGREEEAADCGERVVQAYPFDADAYAMLCGLEGKRQNWGRARTNGMRALEIFPAHELALNNLAMVSYLEGKPREAFLFWDRLAAVQEALGEEEKAAETRQKMGSLKNLKSR